MATIEGVLSVVRGLLEKRRGIRFAVLFGSAATRGPDLARDLDIALSFETAVPWLALGGLMTELEQATGRPVDVVDLESASTLLRWEIFRTGRLITAPDPDAWTSFQTRVPFEWDDLRPYFERESQGLRKALEGRTWSGSTS